MSRSTKKGPFVDARLYGKVQKMQQTGQSDAIKTWARACTIVPEFVGITFMVHNGRQHTKVFVTEDMVGLFSDFTPKFVKRYGDLGQEISAHAAAYAADVRSRRFPGPEHCFGADKGKAKITTVTNVRRKVI